MTFAADRPGSVSGGCKCPISVRRNLEIEANVVVSERTVCYRVLAD